MLKEIAEIQALLPLLGVATQLLEDTNVKTAGTTVGKVINTVTKWTANNTADYFETLVTRGFSREEAMLLTINSRISLQEATKSFNTSKKQQ